MRNSYFILFLCFKVYSSPIPTAYPSPIPTSNPSSIPTKLPSPMPTAYPSEIPTSNPSATPTSLPSEIPTATPSSIPTSIPSAFPTFPPTSSPSPVPTPIPSSSPTFNPSKQPTSQPSSLPSFMPTNQPVQFPTSQPSSDPSVIPSQMPTCQPTSKPSVQPLRFPSTQPSGQPSRLPTTFPVSMPTNQPTTQPSSLPSDQPASHPTCQPSSRPSCFPSDQPSSQPSSHPTATPTFQPSLQPSSKPTFFPSSQPSRQPSSQPSRQPTHTPSNKPSTQPSSQPTSKPTTRNSPRYYNCSDSVLCESNSYSSCNFFTGLVVFQCVNANQKCKINAGSVVIGPSTNISVVGYCEFVIQATGSITIDSKSTLQASAVRLNSTLSSISVYGSIVTSGLGPVGGPGSPTTSSKIGQGGSYGGSGGYSGCNGSYYSNTNSQLGSFDVASDIDLISQSNPTEGSGGGYGNGGRSGGRIILSATTSTISLASTSYLLANGAPSQNISLGAGSGGGILIIAKSLNANGVVSAAGGDVKISSTEKLAESGAAGGGGRISLVVFQATNPNQIILNPQSFIVNGGISFPYSKICLNGGAGSLYVQYGQYSTGTYNAIISIYNQNISTRATTLINTIPPNVYSIDCSERSVVTSLGAIQLPHLSTCERSTQYSTTECSLFSINNATAVSIGINSTSTDSITSYISNGGYKNPQLDVLYADTFLVTETSSIIQQAFTRSINFSTLWFSCSLSSRIEFADQLVIHSLYGLSVLCGVKQTSLPPVINSTFPTVFGYYTYSYLSLYSYYNVTMQSVQVNNAKIQGSHVLLVAGGAVVPASVDVSSCHSNIASSSFSCQAGIYTGSLKYNNTLVVTGTESITLETSSRLESSALLVCASAVTIMSSAVVSSNSRGCDKNTGYGKGTIYYAVGGGGGGYGGSGGSGYGVLSSSPNGGSTYGASKVLYSGSGGGCNGYNNNFNCRGGGMINLIATKLLSLYGTIMSNGAKGSTNGGGGSGGTMIINTGSMIGVGVVEALGGSGGNGSNPGGGGGGGYLLIYNPQQVYINFTYSGVISVSPGNAGLSNSTFSSAQYDLSRKKAKVKEFLNFYGNALSNPYEIKNVTGSFSSPSPSTNPAQAGGNGQLVLPVCRAGYGNSVSAGTICQICTVGKYNYGGNSGACQNCNNAPANSYYTSEGVESSDCPYLCNSGYSTDLCLTPIQYFLLETLGTGGIVGVCLSVLAVIFIPLIYFRYRKLYEWGGINDLKKKEKILESAFSQMNIRGNVNDEFSRSNYTTDNPIIESSKNNGNNSSISTTNSATVEPADRTKALFISKIFNDPFQFTGDRSINNRWYETELRKVYRLNDQDMHIHACRINLLGSNHPSVLRGGPWVLPLCRPVCLRPTLHKKQYKAFADMINQRMYWNPFGWQVILFRMVGIALPPLAAILMREFRKRKAQELLSIIAHYNYACFKCPKQRITRRSLRIGISPDYTLAYLDILFDDELYSPENKPICPLGQAKLPAAFRLAGLGTYLAPFHLDTNDMLLQAVPQTDVASSFIDEAWISFIVELNTVLRSIQREFLYIGLMLLMRFLSDEKNTKVLGGLVIKLCTFSNIEQLPASEFDEIMAMNDDDLKDISSNTPQSLSTEVKDNQETPSDKGLTAGHGAAENLDRDRFSWLSPNAQRDSDMSVTGTNWLTQLGDVISNTMTQEATDPKSGQSIHDANKLRMNSSFMFRKSEVVRESVFFTASEPAISIRQESVENSSSTRFHRWWLAITYILAAIRSCIIIFCNYLSTRILQPLLNSSLGTHEQNPQDPNGYLLNFTETCWAVREGKLSLGIYVTHPKVIENTYIIEDDEFESGDEIEDIINNKQNSDKIDDDDKYNRKNSFDSTGSNNGHNDASTGFNNPLIKSLHPSDLRKKFGDRADEMMKFYNIMLAAESTIGNETTSSIQDIHTITSVSVNGPVGGEANVEKESPGSSPQHSRIGSPSKVKRVSGAESVRSSNTDQISMASTLTAKKDGDSAELEDKEIENTILSPDGSLIKPEYEYQEFAQTRLSRRFSKYNSSKSDKVTEFPELEGEEPKESISLPVRPLDDIEEREEGSEVGRVFRGTDVGDKLNRTSNASSKKSLSITGMVKIDLNRVSNSNVEASPVGLFAHSASSNSNQPMEIETEGSNESAPKAAPTTIVKQKSKRIRKVRNFSKHNLAPSGYQQLVNSWKISNVRSGHGRNDGGLNSKEPVSDGMMRWRTAQKSTTSEPMLQYVDIYGHTRPVAKHNPSLLLDLDTKRSSIDSDLEFSLSNVSMQATHAETSIVRPSEFFQYDGPSRYASKSVIDVLSQKPKKVNSTRKQRSKSPIRGDVTNDSNSEGRSGGKQFEKNRSRDNLETMGERELTNYSTTAPTLPRRLTGNSSVFQSENMDIENGGTNTKPSRNTSGEVTNLPSGPPNSLGGGSTFTNCMNTISDQIKYWLPDFDFKVILYYFFHFMFGSNIYPYGQQYLVQILQFLLLLASVCDMGLVAVILFDFWCLSDNITACQDHTEFMLIILVWPGAFLIAPLMGIVAIVLGPSGTLTRIYGNWSRLAAINNLLILVAFNKYFDYFQFVQTGSIYPIIAFTFSRFFQCCFVDLYIAHIERFRYTRGWDGLHTSLYKTKDNRKPTKL